MRRNSLGTRNPIVAIGVPTEENQSGTGLGLAVVYGIVEQHRGFIRVDTEVGEGTSFRVYWPVSGEPALPRPAEDGTAPPGGTETT